MIHSLSACFCCRTSFFLISSCTIACFFASLSATLADFSSSSLLFSCSHHVISAMALSPVRQFGIFSFLLGRCFGVGSFRLSNAGEISCSGTSHQLLSCRTIASIASPATRCLTSSSPSLIISSLKIFSLLTLDELSANNDFPIWGQVQCQLD